MAAPSEHRPRFCEPCDKRIYEHGFARRTARRLTSEAAPGDAPTNEYPCPESNGWHIGHVPSNKRTRRGALIRGRRPGTGARGRPTDGRRRRRGRPVVARSVTPLAPGEDLAALAARMRDLPPPRPPR